MKINMFIDGKWVEALSGARKNVINPATGEVIASSADGSADDAKVAVKVARKAFDSGIWSDLSADERAEYLYKIADRLEEKADEIARLETANNGKVIRATTYADIPVSIQCFRYYADLIKDMKKESYTRADSSETIIIQEPVGVCGLIVPWNFPLMLAVWQIAPALAAGNTIVIKPAEITPVSVFKLFEIIEEVGLPAGVANLVLGPGSKVGNELAKSHDVDKVAFTGGTKTGQSIMRAAAENMKKITLELGGKSPFIVFDDVDFETAVENAMFGIFHNAGQVCSAASRLLVQETIYDKFVERLAERANKIVVGNGESETIEMGAITSEAHMNDILDYIKSGVEEGAKLVCGGRRLTENELDRGFFIAPTIFADANANMRIVKEEIFGPVLVVQKFKDEEDAIQKANDSIYGLAGAVFTEDMERAKRVVSKLRAGITWINSYHLAYVEGPWGGYKQSGIGRALGAVGLEHFMEMKQINIHQHAKPVGWYAN
ncbi:MULTISPECIES: aldehyde dehydrogenase family protein [Bacillus cereus group]|uniref:aldehyde dehydrogenase family protein n=1 Tax=Bacillus cereus group TaxID=86661 RepID=UPI000BF4FEAA|nr:MULTISPECIES: aldehyde dehydrogenase family protein [Bacillus cereus group]PFA22654.1 aldehyde dehydrogenase [Bacillus cereus]PGZ15517.1 aldehyde dehydrogenase [Bacillus cereus]